MRTHGKAATYRAGCRCDDCCQAAKTYRRWLRHRTAEPTPESRPVYPDALCATISPEQWEWWFAVGRSSEVRRRQNAAKTICSQCPEQARCATWAINHPDEVGIWGGLTETERDTARRRAGYVPDGSVACPGCGKHVAAPYLGVHIARSRNHRKAS